MRHSHFITICFLLTSLLFSCSKVSHNGKLDGRWRMKECYSKTSKEDTHYTQYSNKMGSSIFWSFHLNILQITSNSLLNGHSNNTMCRFVYEGDRLSITNVYINFRDKDSLATDPNTTTFVPLGIRGNASNYHIKRLTSSEMILCSDMDSLIFYQLH